MLSNRMRAFQTAGEEYDVYSVYLRECFLNGLDYRAYGTPLIVIEDRTSAFWSADVNLLQGLRNLFFVAVQRKRRSSMDNITFVDFILRNLIQLPLKQAFNLPVPAALATAKESALATGRIHKEISRQLWVFRPLVGWIQFRVHGSVFLY
jgi:hypothetical protein